jgi:hypothetical protein
MGMRKVGSAGYDEGQDGLENQVRKPFCAIDLVFREPEQDEAVA